MCDVANHLRRGTIRLGSQILEVLGWGCSREGKRGLAYVDFKFRIHPFFCCILVNNSSIFSIKWSFFIQIMQALIWLNDTPTTYHNPPFSLSPLNSTYRKQILLDTIYTLWLLLSHYLFMNNNSHLYPIVLATRLFYAQW